MSTVLKGTFVSLPVFFSVFLQLQVIFPLVGYLDLRYYWYVMCLTLSGSSRLTTI